MRIKDTTIYKGMTVNLGNHQFAKVEVGMTASMDSDNFESDLDKLTTLVDVKLAKEVERVLPKRKTLMEDKPAGEAV